MLVRFARMGATPCRLRRFARMGATPCALVAAACLLAACVHQRSDPAASSGATFCQVARPILWSAADTRRTKEQADAHNRKGKALCGWGKSAP